MMKKPLIIITGPTASGKTALSVELAKKIGGEIISADSMQVYRHMDIGSAKVTKEEMDGVRHHLIDVLDPWDEFNVVVFQKLAKEAMEEIYAAGRIPLIAGGTGFYIQAMKKIAAPIRVELAQYRELASFAQFGSELDASTKEQLAQGERIREVLKQPQYQPMPVEYQVIIIYAATKKYLLDIPTNQVLDFEKELFKFIDTKYPEIPSSIREAKQMTPETEELLKKAIEECKAAR